MKKDDPVSAPVTRVCVGVLLVDGRVLIGRRPAGKIYGGYWEFPGGKLEAGETPEQALHREIREELGIEIQLLRPLDPVQFESERGRVELFAFLCRPASGHAAAIRPHVNDELRWVAPHELAGYRFPPANTRLLHAVQAVGLLDLRDLDPDSPAAPPGFKARCPGASPRPPGGERKPAPG